MSKLGLTMRINELVDAVHAAQTGARRAIMLAELLQIQIGDMPDDPRDQMIELPDGTEPPPENTYAEGQ